jgi:hypothetical protein
MIAMLPMIIVTNLARVVAERHHALLRVHIISG